LLLPGQTTDVSDLLLGTIHEVETQIGRPIAIRDITSHPNAAARTSRGRHDWDANTEIIWLNPKLSHDDQEAVAAHELAHVLQKAEGYCQVATKRDKDGQPIFPKLTLLGTTINSMLTDVMADQWAASRGFKVNEGLETDALPKAIADIQAIDSREPESVDWDAYYSVLTKLAASVCSGAEIKSPVVIGNPEIKTQIRAVWYAGMRLRLSPHGLFDKLDTVWAQLRPEARRLGSEIYSLVNTKGCDNKGGCEASVVVVIEHLKIPPWLLVVKRPLTDEIIWPH
jgi:IrrE N-terminal-like domain